MSSRPRRSFIAFAAVIAGVIAGPVAGANATPPIWEPSFGATIPGITDTDDAATAIPLGTFTFPFYGSTHTGADTFGVSSNGLVEFSAGNADNTPSGNDARNGAPKIAALWSDLNPSNPGVDGGSVFVNTFSDDGDPAIDRVVFTWDSALFGCESSPSCRARAQIQLFESGRIVFGYDGVLTNQAVDNYGNPGLMPVVARGGFGPPPGFLPGPPGIDYSESVPFTGGDLIFEHFASDPTHFDLDQNNLVFVPSGAGSFEVTSTVPFNSVAEAGGAATGDDTTRPRPRLRAGPQRLGEVISKGLRLQVSCNEACFAEIKLASKSPKVKNAGSGVVELFKAGKRSVRVKLNRAARRALSDEARATFKVTAAVFDESGNKRTVKKTVVAK